MNSESHLPLMQAGIGAGLLIFNHFFRYIKSKHVEKICLGIEMTGLVSRFAPGESDASGPIYVRE